jgi:hypothetical protein
MLIFFSLNSCSKQFSAFRLFYAFFPAILHEINFMNQVYIDNALIGLSIIGAAVVSKCMRGRITGLLFSSLLLIPPLLVFLNMWAHCIAVTVVNIRRYNAGNFQYSFSFYSLLLFGLVFIVLSGTTIHLTKQYICGQRRQKRFVHLLNAITAVLFLPVGFINPIGFLPVICSLVSSSALFLYDLFKMRQRIQRRREFSNPAAIRRVIFQKQA